jgi:molybdate/tungstate transport system substrate-binding protein
VVAAVRRATDVCSAIDSCRATGAGLPRVAAAAAATLLGAALLLGVVAIGACSSSSSGSSVSLVDADSLIIPFGQLAQAYQAAHPGVRVTTESHGSIQVIRQVTDLGRSFDVLTSADAALVALMMEKEGDAGVAAGTTGVPTADWYAVFATNRMVLAYSPHSRYASLLRSGDWIRALTTPGLQFGLADPRFDATGYRALMVLQLAQAAYHDDHLFADLTVGRFSPPITVARSGGRDVIDVPELLAPVSGTGLVVRDASIELVALLEAGDLDCAFEYESVARQHHLPFVTLPAQIDLGSQRYAADYAKVAVAIAFQRFATVKPLFVGAPIAYAVTIPLTAHDPAGAARFVAFLLGPRGRAILAANDQPAVTPALVDHYGKLPAALRPLCVAMKPGEVP